MPQAIIGSIDAARLAGSPPAIRAAARNTAAPVIITSGSTRTDTE